MDTGNHEITEKSVDQKDTFCSNTGTDDGTVASGTSNSYNKNNQPRDVNKANVRFTTNPTTGADDDTNTNSNKGKGARSKKNKKKKSRNDHKDDEQRRGGENRTSNNLSTQISGQDSTGGKRGHKKDHSAFEFFWNKLSPYSQWYECKFTVEGKTFNCAGQYMMYSKAMLFGDTEIAKNVLQTNDPREHKKSLGRRVNNFDQKKWDANCVGIVEKGNMAKFSQNEELKKELLSTFPKTLVEASAMDKIWGIGLEESDSRAWNRNTWEGQNLLGHTLTKVRKNLMLEEKQPEESQTRRKKSRKEDKEHGETDSADCNIKDKSKEQKDYACNSNAKKDNNKNSRNDHQGGGQKGSRKNRTFDNFSSQTSAQASGGGYSGHKKEHKEFEFFWKKWSPYSQWYECEFTVEGKTFSCAEQYMMYSKAMLFGDTEIAEEVLQTSDAREHKSLGRRVNNFDQKIWDANCNDIVKKGNLAKFSQNEVLKKTILSTHPKILVEASPMDKIWGIGLEASDSRAWNRKTWKGQNLLGFALTQVREDLMLDNLPVCSNEHNTNSSSTTHNSASLLQDDRSQACDALLTIGECGLSESISKPEANIQTGEPRIVFDTENLQTVEDTLTRNSTDSKQSTVHSTAEMEVDKESESKKIIESRVKPFGETDVETDQQLIQSEEEQSNVDTLKEDGAVEESDQKRDKNSKSDGIFADNSQQEIIGGKITLGKAEKYAKFDSSVDNGQKTTDNVTTAKNLEN